IQTDGQNLTIHVLDRITKGAGDVVELEIGPFVFEGTTLAKIVIRRETVSRLHLIQQQMLESMAYGVPFKSIMESLCRKVEALVPSVVCSIVQVDGRKRLRHIASPSLPKHFLDAIDGIPIGPKVGSCGTAAYYGEPVEVRDIATDPLWEGYSELALELGLRACWSSPIKASDGRVVGAFAFYFPRSRGPTNIERQIVVTCLHLCMIAMEHEETRLRAYEFAFTDALTQLANRARFQQRVSECLAFVDETGQRVAIQCIGLDRFQAVNETLGYAVGDELLKLVADRLRSVVRDHDAVSRIGGDEFALIQVGALRDEDIAKRARSVIDLLATPFEVAGQSVQLGASTGIAIGPRDANTPEDLIQCAALAMRRSKELGRGTYFFYEKVLNERMQRRRRVEAELRQALASDELELYFQPIFNLHTGAVEKAEALVRWHHPQRGMVLPSEFIPLAEESGLIEQLGVWVLRKACRVAAQWPAHVAVAVNLSPLQFDAPGLVQTIVAALAESGLDPARLELEITESVLLRDSAVNAALLDQVSELGVSIALDDFGTGYSSLSYLHRFSFNRVKIDQSFVRDMPHNEGSLKIVRAIVMLAHSLSLKVTAEGVETDEQLAAVQGEGCDSVQGFYMGIPAPATDFMEHFVCAYTSRFSAA
ncbi:MAG: EAL domain-containing protein, partial [Hyphomicrobium sp.]